jgi:hypothetical protein
MFVDSIGLQPALDKILFQEIFNYNVQEGMTDTWSKGEVPIFFVLHALNLESCVW